MRSNALTDLETFKRKKCFYVCARLSMSIFFKQLTNINMWNVKKSVVNFWVKYLVYELCNDVTKAKEGNIYLKMFWTLRVFLWWPIEEVLDGKLLIVDLLPWLFPWGSWWNVLCNRSLGLGVFYCACCQRWDTSFVIWLSLKVVKE